MIQPPIRDRQLQIYAGAASLVLGAWLLHCAYDARGKTRPFALRFLPAG